RVEKLVVQVDLKDGVRQYRHDVDESIDDRERIHVGAQTLRVHAHYELVIGAAGLLDLIAIEHVRVRKHTALTSPPPPNRLRGSGCECDQLVRGRDEHILLPGVSYRLPVV